MALPAHLLQRLPDSIKESGLVTDIFVPEARGETPDGPFSIAAPDASASPLGADAARMLPLGIAELEAALPDGGIARGAVTELAVLGGSGLGTSIALAACRAAQREASHHGGAPLTDTKTTNALTSAGWCAFIDPSGTLYAPGVVGEGVTLERLLVVRPPLEALSRVALRTVESHAFSVVIVDLMGLPGSSVDVPLGAWARIVRRLALAIERTRTSVILLTDAAARRPLPLPVAIRVELARTHGDRLSVRIAKERHGRVSAPRSIVWARRPHPTPEEDRHARLPA